MSLHGACYQGRVDVVAQLLASGANPYEPADPTARAWISCGGRPRPLNCVAIAWTMTENHVEIARLLIEHGAVVDDSVLRGHQRVGVGGVERVGGSAANTGFAPWFRRKLRQLKHIAGVAERQTQGTQNPPPARA